MDLIEQYELVVKENQCLMNTMKECWKEITALNQKLQIFKEDQGMDRQKEMLIYHSREKIMEARTFLEQVIEFSQSKIKETNVFLAKIKFYQKRNEQKELKVKND